MRRKEGEKKTNEKTREMTEQLLTYVQDASHTQLHYS